MLRLVVCWGLSRIIVTTKYFIYPRMLQIADRLRFSEPKQVPMIIMLVSDPGSWSARALAAQPRPGGSE